MLLIAIFMYHFVSGSVRIVNVQWYVFPVHVLCYAPRAYVVGIGAL